jgi:hypothetical protein
MAFTTLPVLALLPTSSLLKSVERLSLSEVRPSAVFSFLETCGWVAGANRPCEFHLGFFGVALSAPACCLRLSFSCSRYFWPIPTLSRERQ